ncbi:hypothetical protein PC116_g15265 [Phytophthora cactorum]|uniref:Uncharacterized protein n=1 Tax=Phytophthora cactorum TaxID=29920 RepID=A0A8T1BCN2_9STRA|nr:hypothetical protein Pcac1_g2476 [Phytophthora cactorum]KAG2880477.1 hypothetical protein PC114_g22069 [Phytophthora cactorum]KAG2900865.1 hypothetical protein PC117_g21859 [Phytophthora cactorum]KAG3143069.1 hypothetical protein C6341_g19195 [Phytophthora cactorum]KAG4236654.1 hypothetical protein PC116_g15265 [Phytophthora cactorum]
MALDAATRGQSPASVDGIKLRPIQRLKEVSQIFRLMTKNDTSFLGGVSSMSLLDMAAQICSQKLFDSRVLSRDMLKLHGDLSDASFEMCGALDERNLRYPDAVTARVNQICDCLRPNGELDVRALPGCPYSGIELISDTLAKAMCSKVAEVIESIFAGSPDIAGYSSGKSKPSPFLRCSPWNQNFTK